MDVIFCEAVGRQVLRTAGAMVQKGELCYDYHPNGRLRRVGLIQYSETPLVERRCDWDQVAVLLDFSYDPWGRRIHNDHRGAPVFMTDRDARVVWTAMYRPYGEAYVDDDPDGDGTLVTSNLRYPGQYEDTIEDFPEGERLYYNVMRYYDPGLGRYMTTEDMYLELYGNLYPSFHVSHTVNYLLFTDYIVYHDYNDNRYIYTSASPIMEIDIIGLSSLHFDGAHNRLTVSLSNGQSFILPAGNVTINPSGNPSQVGSHGPAPTGTYPVQRPVYIDPSSPDYCKYGPIFFPVGSVDENGVRIDIARKRGIGIHGGRTGPFYPTQGCIRLSNSHMELLGLIDIFDPITTITIERSRRVYHGY